MKRLFTVPALLLASLAGVLAVPAAAQAATTDVGVIPANRSCPAGTEAVVIRMDDEDSGNTNSRGGFIGAVGSTSNTEFFFCRVNGTAFRGVVQSGSFRPYAVLKLGANCPNGSQEFSRRFDNEDDSNNNSYSAPAGISSIAQSMVSAGSNTTMNVRIAR